MTASALALIFALAGDAQGEVRGRILDARTAGPVAGATVRLRGEAIDRLVTTGTDGTYAFTEVSPGSYRIQVLHPGYDPAELRVALHGTAAVVVDVPLVVRPIEVRPIIVATDREAPSGTVGGEAGAGEARPAPARHPNRPLAPQASSALADMVAAEIVPDPSRDPNGGRRAHVLYIWGAGADRGRVLVDGTTVNAPLHLGGMLPPVDPEVLAGAEIRSGGISPRYDGGTTYIMDFATRPADAGAARFRGELDPLTTRLGLETAVGHDAGVLLGARRVNTEAVDLLVARPFGYGYSDLLLRADRRLAEGGRLHATFMGTREAISIPRDQAEDEAAWRNMAASAVWRDGGAPSRHTARFAASRGVADLPLLSAPGGHMEVAVDRLAGAAERRWSSGEAGGAAGFELEHLRFHRRSRADAEPGEPATGSPVACTVALPCFGTTASTLAAYGDAAWQPAPAASVRTGLRIAYRPGNGWDLLPRLAVTRLLGDDAAVTLAAGRFSQPYASVRTSAAGTGELEAVAAVARSTHVELNLDRRGDRSAVAATVFLRLHEASDDAPAGTAPGFDLSWVHNIGAVSTMLGYSLWRTPASPAEPDREDRHLAAAGLIASRGPVALNLSAAYGRGLPYTSIALEHPRASLTGSSGAGVETLLAADRSPARPFVRIDAAASGEWRLRRGDREVTLAPYAKLINALGHRDALFYYHEDGIDGSPRPLARLPAIPVVGVRWVF